MCFTLQRYKIESNSQPCVQCTPCAIRCVSHCKDTKLKAIHNKTIDLFLLPWVVFHTAKIQNWKQFTTIEGGITLIKKLCFTLQRYKIESNSQHYILWTCKTQCCVSHCKDTKLKAIHNWIDSLVISEYVVFHTAKIQNWKQFTTCSPMA